jgi:hypothetical protein
MSLAVLAQDMASKGRNGDSMLVHMTPHEVAGLQALAMKHGGSLTINPETGLHEANFLKSLLPIIAGFALGPAGFGLVSSGLGAAAAVGGITGLATGSLSKGLMAGLGAYGGFGIGESLMGAGADSLTRSALSMEGALPSVDNITQVTGEGYGGSAANYSDQVNSAVKAASDASRAMPKADLLSQGLSSVANDPMGFAKQNWAPLAAAAAPIAADMMVPTTTKAPATDTGNIRKFSFDPYSQRYTPQGVFPAAGYKGGMADGGIVALAGGFTPQQFKEQMYAGGVDDTAATKRGLELASQAGLNAVDTTNLWNQALGTKFTPDDYSAVMRQYNIAAPTANTNFVKSLATDTSTAADFGREVNAKGLSTQDVNAALASSGLSGAAQFALTNPNIGDTANTSETYGGLKGLSNNINYWLQNHEGASADDINTEMKKWDLTDEDFKRATGKTVKDYTTGALEEVVSVAPGTGGNNAFVNPNGTVTQTALGDTNVITNTDGTKTVMPTNTVDDITNLYTKGGGSTGYTVKAPIDMAEFNTRFNKLRPGSDSESAYKYLMGQGAYPTHSNVGEIMKPYSEAVLGIPQDIRTKKYLYDNKTRKMVLNPDYVPMSFDTKGVQSYGLSQSDISKYLTANNKAPDADIYSWAVANNVTPEQIAEANKGDLALIRAKYDAAKKATAGTTGTVDVTNKANKPSTDPGSRNEWLWDDASNKWIISEIQTAANGGMMGYAMGGLGNLGGYSDGGRLLKGPGDGVSDSIPATIGQKQQPARLADGEFVIPARIVSELGNGSTDAGAKKLYAMMDRVQRARGKTTGKNKVAANSRAEKYLPA